MLHCNRKIGLASGVAVAIILYIFTTSALAALVKNIVLVHGAWGDGSGWKAIYDILLRDGYNVTMVQEPETSLRADVAATKRVLDRQPGPCILAGHSYGGSIVTGSIVT